MFSINPFAELSATISPNIMQWYVIVMALFVAGGTLFDVIHKGSAKFFFRDAAAKTARARTPIGGGQRVSLRIHSVLVDVLTSAEFGMTKRRLAHVLTFWGFSAYVIATVVMVFGYPTPDMATPAWLPGLWYLGAAMVMVGGYWYWFFLRVDIVKENNPPLRLVRADLFVVSLVLSVTFGFVWGLIQSSGGGWADLLLALYLLATTVLFVGVPWSKFSHMFYKSAAAMQRRIEEAEGSSHQPPPADRPLL